MTTEQYRTRIATKKIIQQREEELAEVAHHLPRLPLAILIIFAVISAAF